MNDKTPTPDSAPDRDDTGGDDTARALLAAARRLFSERGYDGASIRAITSAAGVNLGAVTYHFGSKEALYHAVLDETVSPLRDRVDQALAGPGSRVDRVVDVVRVYLVFLGETPELPRFLLQSVAAGQLPPPPVQATMRGIVGRVGALVQEAQEAGEIRPGSPLLMVLGLISQPIYLTLMKDTLRQVLGVDLTSPDHRDQVMEHVTAFARAAIVTPEAPNG